MEVSHFIGSPLSGGVSAAHDTVADPERVWGVRITAFALEAYPETVFDSLAPRVQLVTRERGGEPLVPVIRVVRGRFGVVDDPPAFVRSIEEGALGRNLPLMRIVAALAPGVTTTLRLEENRFAEKPAAGAIRLWRVPEETEGGTSDAAVQFAFVFEGVVEQLDDDSDDEMPVAEGTKDGLDEPTPETLGELEAVREGILLRPWSLADGHALSFVFRFPFGTSDAQAVAVVVEVRPRGEWSEEERAEFEPAVARCFAAIAEADELVGENRAVSIEEDVWSGLASAVVALALPRQQRTALVYLAHTTGARLVEELALSASDDVVGAIATSIRAATVAEKPTDAETLAWLLTREACEVLGARLAGRKTSTGIEAVLAIHTGEVGRHAPVLEAVTRAADDLADFRARLAQENLTYLEDVSPAARARALRWLTARDLAPQGYDPLAPARERRLALSRAAEAAAAASAAKLEETP